MYRSHQSNKIKLQTETVNNTVTMVRVSAEMKTIAMQEHLVFWVEGCDGTLTQMAMLYQGVQQVAGWKSMFFFMIHEIDAWIKTGFVTCKKIEWLTNNISDWRYKKLKWLTYGMTTLASRVCAGVLKSFRMSLLNIMSWTTNLKNDGITAKLEEVRSVITFFLFLFKWSSKCCQK